MKVKYITEKEVAIEEDVAFRRDFLNSLASSLTESSFKHDSIPYSSITDIHNAADLDDWHKTLYCTFQFYKTSYRLVLPRLYISILVL